MAHNLITLGFLFAFELAFLLVLFSVGYQYRSPEAGRRLAHSLASLLPMMRLTCSISATVAETNGIATFVLAQTSWSSFESPFGTCKVEESPWYDQNFPAIKIVTSGAKAERVSD